MFLVVLGLLAFSGGSVESLMCYSCSAGDTAGLSISWLYGVIPPVVAGCDGSSMANLPTVSCNSFCVSDYLNIAVPWTGLSKTIFVRACADQFIAGGKAQAEGNCCKAVFYNKGGIYYNAKGCTCTGSDGCNNLNTAQINSMQTVCPDPCLNSPCQMGQTCSASQNGIGFLCNGAVPTGTPTAQPTVNPLQAVANMFMMSINESVDPCQDFYQFSCGNWIKNHPIPQGSSSVISFGILDDQITAMLNKTLRMPMNGTMAWPPAIQQAQLAFSKCINVNPSIYTGQRLLKVVNNYGGWPAANPNWTPGQQGLLTPGQLGGILNSIFGLGTILSSYIDLDYRHNIKHMLHLSQASLTYPTIYYTTNSTAGNIRNNLAKLMTSIINTMASVSGNTVNSAQVTADVNAMIALEFQLAQISVPDAQQRNASAMYNIFNLQQAMARWPNLQMDKFFMGILAPLSPANRTMVQGKFCVDLPSYYDSLNPILQSGSQRVLQNYLIWRYLYQYMEFLPAFRGPFEEFRRSMDHIEALPDQSVACVGMVVGNLPYAVGRLYIEQHFNKLANMPRNKLSTMIMSVLGAFRQMISQLSWMDLPAKVLAIKKVNGIVQNVAYPNWMMDNNQLNMKYAALNINSTDNLWDAMQKLTRFTQTQSYQLLFQPTDRSDFQASPAIVNAWYQPSYNSITFPAGILNAPFFEADWPASVNYGGMGVVMGHELTHGFDDEGVQWDANGTLNTWLDSYSQGGFKNMANCIINEYNGFCFPSLPQPNCVSGVRTQGENIADNGGIKAAFLAFKSNEILDGADPPLPGHMGKYTHDQLFFMSFGQVWCRNIKMSALPQQLLLDPHSPARDRVLGTVKNFPTFGKVFNCPAGSPMYPKNHCTIW